MQKYSSPVYNIQMIPIEKIQKANAYNPNSVAPPEMKLLYQSIKKMDMQCQVVCYYIQDVDKYEIVDGFHRYTTMLKHKDIYEREGCLPVSVDKPISDRMASTIRHNKSERFSRYWFDDKHCCRTCQSWYVRCMDFENIGMDADEL